MTSISIVCDACGHHVLSAPNPRELVVASSDRSEPGAAGSPRTVPNRCPCCGAVWDLLHPGDEFLVGLTNVNPAGHHRTFVHRS